MRRRSQEIKAKALIIGAVKGSAEEARMRGWSKELTDAETDNGTEAETGVETVGRDPIESEAFIVENIIGQVVDRVVSENVCVQVCCVVVTKTGGESNAQTANRKEREGRARMKVVC